jgi:hypothetical protein
MWTGTILGAVIAVVIWEVGRFIYGSVRVAPKTMDTESLTTISRLERERDEARGERDAARQLASTKADLAAAHDARLRELEVQLVVLTGSQAEKIHRDDWEKLAAHFKALPGFGVRADWFQHGSGAEIWSLHGGPSDVRDVEALCRLAGTMLLKSPRVLEQLSNDVVTQTDPLDRWLVFLKEQNGGLDGRLLYGATRDKYGVERPYYSDCLSSVATVSSRVCLHCSAQET